LTGAKLKSSEQLRKHAFRVTSLIEKVITRLDSLDQIVTLLTERGLKHCTFGVKPEQLQMIGPHFIKTIQPVLGDAWNEQMQCAWTALFTFITYHMMDGMS